MRSFILIAFAALALPTLAADHPTEKGFIPLFDGKTLKGWTGDKSTWVVRDGAITCLGTAGNNWLVLKGKTFKDFELRLSFKFTKGNSGVQVRSRMVDHQLVRGYQAEIATHNKMGLWHHSKTPIRRRSHLSLAGERVTLESGGKKTLQKFADPATLQALCKDGQWNTMTIIADGPRLVQKVNGHVYSDLTDLEHMYAMPAGLIALQDHGKTVAAFKDIRIKPLD
ncbi:MAG: 3-keto-disaccharide hydrolase [Planctomycetota bacterium]|jgi:hypothetical protein